MLEWWVRVPLQIAASPMFLRALEYQEQCMRDLLCVHWSIVFRTPAARAKKLLRGMQRLDVLRADRWALFRWSMMKSRLSCWARRYHPCCLIDWLPDRFIDSFDRFWLLDCLIAKIVIFRYSGGVDPREQIGFDIFDEKGVLLFILNALICVWLYCSIRQSQSIRQSLSSSSALRTRFTHTHTHTHTHSNRTYYRFSDYTCFR